MSMNNFEDAAYSLDGVLSEKHSLDDTQLETVKRAAVALHNANALLKALEQVLDDLSGSTMKFPKFGVCEAVWDEAIAAIKKAGGDYE